MIFEITFKNFENVDDICNLLKKYKILNINITNKSKDIDNLEIASLIKQKLNFTVNVVTNYSIQVHKKRSIQDQYNDFILYNQKSLEIGIKENLLISGVPKHKIQTKDLLKYSKNKILSTDVSIGVAFNPFLQGLELEIEHQNLCTKLENKNVKSVYFQLGEDVSMLNEGINFVFKKQKYLNIFISVLIPNLEILTKMSFRMWHGVFYTQKFLKNLDYAKNLTKQILVLCKEKNIKPLLCIYPFKSLNIENFYEDYKDFLSN